MGFNMKWITDRLQGRSTALIFGFFIAGNILQWCHKLDQTYITYMGIMLAAVIGHSIKEDVHTAKMTDNGQRVDGSVPPPSA